jgi:hypothetical protein
MSEHRLHLRDPGTELDNNDFWWADHPSASFRTNLTVGLTEFPRGRRANRDFLRLAVLVFLVDRTRRRPRRWARELRLHVPVERVKPWADVAPELERTLGFLTGDRWQLQFHRASRPDASPDVAPCPPAAEYMLLSGGADSLSGALLLADPHTTCFVSHSAMGQSAVVAVLAQLWDAKPMHFVRYVRRRSKTPAGKSFGDERTSRSRSLLFFAMGLLAASARRSRLLVPENGFASLNPPMAPERSGSLSTRTTHPWYLFELRRILAQVGAHAELTNPFQDNTKGELFAEVARRYGADSASKLLSGSYSCSNGTVKFHAPQGVRHCGICYGCLIRRAAFAASGVEDRTAYLARVTDPVGSVNDWLTPKTRQDVTVAEYAVARGSIDPADIIATGLPPTSDVDAAIALAQRGLDELKLLFL